MINKLNEFERITDYLREENCPRTPQEISEWTSIRLGEVYFILQNNKNFFIEIIDENTLKGWILSF